MTVRRHKFNTDSLSVNPGTVHRVACPSCPPSHEERESERERGERESREREARERGEKERGERERGEREARERQEASRFGLHARTHWAISVILKGAGPERDRRV